MQGTDGHLSAEQKQLAFRLRAKGWRLLDIAKEIGCTAPMVGIVRGHEKVRTYGHEKSAPMATRSPHLWPSDVLTPR